MRRRSRASSKPTKARSRKAKAPSAVRHSSSSLAGQENEVARLAQELNDAQEERAAIAEVLRIISSSPGELEPVFQAMLENAVRICDAKFGNIYRKAGDRYKLAATLNTPPAFADYRLRSPIAVGSTPAGRMLMSKELIHTADLAAQPAYV